MYLRKKYLFGEYGVVACGGGPAVICAAVAAALASKAGITPRALGYAPVARSLFNK